MNKIYLICENPAWSKGLINYLKLLNQEFELWDLGKIAIEFNNEPPYGIFFNKMSASSVFRDNSHLIEKSIAIIRWLEEHNRKIINGSRALELELSKIEQYRALRKIGIPTPNSIIIYSCKEALKVSMEFSDKPFIIKPNTGGQGKGVFLFNTIDEFFQFHEEYGEKYFLNATIFQEYHEPDDGHIIRLEFINGKFLYAVRVETFGGFELCPAEACITPSNEFDFSQTKSISPKFNILKDYQDDMIPVYEGFLKINDLKICALEYLEDKKGNRFV